LAQFCDALLAPPAPPPPKSLATANALTNYNVRKFRILNLLE
jgi:hypothetical protein